MGFENITKDSNYYQSSSGDYGFRLIESGTTTDSFRCIQAIEESVISTSTLVGDTLNSVTIPQGLTIFGKFDSVTVVSGKVIAYLGA